MKFPSMPNIRAHIMPYFARLLSSDALRNGKLVLAQTKAKLKGEWPVVEVYLHPKDPYSWLLLQVLPTLEERYHLRCRLYWFDTLQTDMFPEPELLRQYGLRDCHWLANIYSLQRPPELLLERVQWTELSAKLHSIANDHDDILDDIVKKSMALIQRQQSPTETDNGTKMTSIAGITGYDIAKLIQNAQKQEKQGHYAPGTCYFAGEWYWGLDRLYHLEQRLNQLNLNRTQPKIQFKQHLAVPETQKGLDHTQKKLTLYWSARSPYSYLALLKCDALAKRYRFQLDVKPVMPMMMRNMPVPEAKKMAIFHDTKREAKAAGIDYGYVADPLGHAVIRCYSLLKFARQYNAYMPFLVSFAKAVNAEGILAQTDKGLKIIVERAGLDWSLARQQLLSEENSNQNWQHQGWYKEVDNNLQEMQAQGVWGVPSMVFENQVVWGQDRIPCILSKLLNS